jgi:hypothetical protein
MLPKCRFSKQTSHENMSFKFQHFYDEKKCPRVTICYVIDGKYDNEDDNFVSMGIAVCGKITPSKKIMRQVSFGRALKAYVKKINADPMSSIEKDVIQKVNMHPQDKEYILRLNIKSFVACMSK